MRIDVIPGADRSRVAVKVDMTDVAVAPVGMQMKVDVRDRASLIRVLVGMCVHMRAAVPVRVSVH